MALQCRTFSSISSLFFFYLTNRLVDADLDPDGKFRVSFSQVMGALSAKTVCLFDTRKRSIEIGELLLYFGAPAKVCATHARRLFVEEMRLQVRCIEMHSALQMTDSSMVALVAHI